MRNSFHATIAAGGLFLVAACGNAETNVASAAQQNCDPGKPGSELTGAEAQNVYQCIADQLHADYKEGGKRWIPEDYVNNYRDWTAASQFPAAPGVHGGRFLLTWVSEPGADEYLKYQEDPNIPAGTVIAKESFSVNDQGKVSPGPLFLMEKVEAGKSPETDDWYYMMVGPNGQPQAIDVMSACSACHQGAFGHQGGLGYPVEEARIDQ
ncbi:MAG TPA: cytochrome P460 family protein [Alphaproteobacteria bacterium]|nr:cytochrome P460 family protein [Alphaproteobacteria bacterium]